jgi:hypothetical protein
MIRRGFWLMAGAALGVAGYRKAGRLTRTLTGQQAAPQSVRRSGLVEGTRSAGGFVRDVRDGMADYHALRGEKLRRSLQSQRDRMLSGPSQRGPREP